jgi:hypothetical protein
LTEYTNWDIILFHIYFIKFFRSMICLSC